MCNRHLISLWLGRYRWLEEGNSKKEQKIFILVRVSGGYPPTSAGRDTPLPQRDFALSGSHIESSSWDYLLGILKRISLAGQGARGEVHQRLQQRSLSLGNQLIDRASVYFIPCTLPLPVLTSQLVPMFLKYKYK